MSDTPGAPALFNPSPPPDRTVEPTATADAKATTVYGVGEVLKTIIHKVPVVFHSENDADEAMRAVDAWVRASVGEHALNAIDTSEARAAKEDVSQRIPPGGQAAAVVSGPVLDYAKLAEAILSAQRQHAREVEGTGPQDS